MAWAAEYQPYEAAEPEDIEALGEDGISSYSGIVEPGYVSFLSDVQMKFLQSVVDKVAIGKHYVICSYVSSGSTVNYFLFVGSDVDLSFEFGNPLGRVIGITFNSLDAVYYLSFSEKSDLFDYTNPDEYFYVMPNADFVGGTARIYYDPLSSVYSVKTEVNGNFFNSMSSTIISDLAYFPDISSRGEVQYDYAACVILASFLLFSLFRSLWRSIRGRVD